MAQRIALEDPKLFPAQAFLNAIPERDFAAIAAKLLQGVGATFDDACCQFPQDLDPGEKPFEGVRCSLADEEVVLDRRTFNNLLKQAAEAHLTGHPAERPRIDALFRGV